MRFGDLTREERAEVDALVHEAYTAADGTTRTHAEAMAQFDRLLASAVQARREWTGVLLDDWREAGMRRFLRDRWKHAEVFTFAHRGRVRSRTVRRGAFRPDADGRVRSTQLALWEWSAEDLRSAIADAARQVAEHQANIALYRDMLGLLDSTGAPTVTAALAERGQSWDEWLASREERAS